MHGPLHSSAQSVPHADASNLHWAIYYANRGWQVLPLYSVEGGRCTCGDVTCRSPGSHPRTQDGVKDASAHSWQILRWWRWWRSANVGIATGVASGLLVLDVDPANGGDASYEQIRKQSPELLEVRTGSGGTHLYFECRSLTPSRAKILPGIDVKADADYVIAPPSLDVGGSQYQFASNSGLVLPPLPAALRDLIFQASSQQSHQTQQSHQSQSQQGQGQQSQQNPQSQQSQSQTACQSQQGQSQTGNQTQQNPGQQSQGQQSQSKQSQSRFTAGVQPDPVPWPDPVDGVVLFNELTAALGRYLALPEGALETKALWVLFTHTFEVAEVSPRLALLSPLPECGKTTALSILSRLVRRAMLTSNVTAAVVFRAIDRDRPTLLMDEADTYFEKRGDEFRGILNSGHTRDAAVVWRTVGDQFNPKPFSTWAPLAVAKIGKLPDTIASRSIIIEMRRKRADESVTRYRPDRDRSSLDELARKCARWEKDNLQKLAGADPIIPKQLNNRVADNWRPLFAIADALGGDSPIRARRSALALAGDEIEVTSAEQLLANIRSIGNVYIQRGIDRISSKDLCAELGKIEGGHIVIPDWLAAMLRPFGIRPHSIRIGQSTPKGYMWKDFEDAFARYLPENRNSATSDEN
jgi:putative DNA primase/helicase